MDVDQLIDLLPGPAWTALADGRTDAVNARWCDYTGLTAEAARGLGWRSAVHPDDLFAAIEAWDRIVAAGAPGEFEARLLRSDGAYRRFLFRASPLADGAGDVAHWYCLQTDIDDQRRAEALLSGEKQLLEMVPLPRFAG